MQWQLMRGTRIQGRVCLTHVLDTSAPGPAACLLPACTLRTVPTHSVLARRALGAVLTRWGCVARWGCAVQRASRGGAAEAAAAGPVAPEHHELAEQVLASHFTEGAELGLIDRMQRAVGESALTET